MKVSFMILICFIYLTKQNCTDRPLITKVFKQNKQNYILDDSNKWKQYPQLKITIQLAQSRLVFIGYTITIGSSGQSHLVTRLMVDNYNQIQSHRAISGNTDYHTNSVSGYVPLSQGSHQIRVQYRTQGTFVVNSAADWVTAYLSVTY